VPDAETNLTVVPEYVLRPPVGFYRGLNPATKLVIALCTAALAFVLRGWLAPLLALGAVGATVARARLGRAVLPFALATLPLLISIVLVNTFLYPGATDTLFTVGPLRATGSGLTVAGQASLRIFAFALSVAVFALTTPTDDLLADLERRGLGRRASFIIGSAIQTVPRLAARAGEVADSQRARGLDTQGSPWRRIRGIVPLAGPMITGALSEVEERTMALEARAFSAPAGRATLRPMPDDGAQRVGRWLLGLVTIGLIVATLTGRLALP
jgi:energy-coupling factor transport system permease protein